MKYNKKNKKFTKNRKYKKLHKKKSYKKKLYNKKSYKGGDIVNDCIKRVQTYNTDNNSDFIDYDRLFENSTTS